MPPPPVPRTEYAAAIAGVRQILAAAGNTQDAKEIILKAFQALEAQAAIAEKLVNSVGFVEEKVAHWESVSGKSGSKPLAESKCVGNLKNLGSDKSEFKSWNDKLINALAQTLGTPWRKFMRNLNKTLDQDRKVLTQQEIKDIDGAASVDIGAEASESLFYVLVEKTDGDAALRVNSGEPGEGLEAYMRVYLWFAGTTGLALTEKTRILMHPTPVKQEHEIANALERWAE